MHFSFLLRALQSIHFGNKRKPEMRMIGYCVNMSCIYLVLTQIDLWESAVVVQRDLICPHDAGRTLREP